MTGPPPLTGIRVLEFAGLAPGPFAGLLLADYGASVLRIDRAIPNLTHSSSIPPPTADLLTRHKSSIAVDLKSSAGISFIKSLVPHCDVIIDPFRPGVLEKLGLSPDVLLQLNPRIILARMTGFRRDGKYKDMAGHDINYIAVSGALSLLGRKMKTITTSKYTWGLCRRWSCAISGHFTRIASAGEEWKGASGGSEYGGWKCISCKLSENVEENSHVE
ncbi:caf931bd-7f99-4828-a542-39f7313745a2 [Sclerotinia trifoliorum]|uniref:Caf931bd-7f99-4828-a542-39f7313745a2 n=1 Tax=Sclerotinia trifoliorum TaxID=28548 RepID=A0A8H2ZSW4_9HELO|nr:caf931bd-7f99-4828-a542-39f7313745a2 [Sclerotinia trifoliorum]